MRILIFWLTLFMLVSCQPAEQPEGEATPEPMSKEEPTDVASLEPTEVAPDHYKVELENDHVRVVRITYAAGESSATHSHPDGVVVFLKDGTAMMTLEDGRSEERSGKAGDAQWAPAETHTPEATTDIEAVLIEVKGEGGEVEIAETNGTASDPDHHKVEFENERVRIVRMTYPAGYKTPLHDHLPGASVMLTDYKAKSAPEGEEGEEAEGKAGEVSWADAAPPHVSENTGEEEFSLIRVEIKIQ